MSVHLDIIPRDRTADDNVLKLMSIAVKPLASLPVLIEHMLNDGMEKRQQNIKIQNGCAGSIAQPFSVIACS